MAKSKLTERLKLQNSTSILLSFSLIIPLTLFVLGSLVIYRYLLYQNDLQLLERIKNQYNHELTLQNNDNYKNARMISDKLKNLSLNETLKILQNDDNGFQYFSVIVDSNVYSNYELSNFEENALIEYSKNSNEYSKYNTIENRLYLTYNIEQDDRNLIFFYPFKQPTILSIILFYDINLHLDSEKISKYFSQLDRDEYKVHLDEDIFYFKRIFNIHVQPIGWFEISLKREFNLPVRQTFWVAALMAVFISILIGLILSKIVTNIVFTPIEKLTVEMDQLAKNPIDAKPIEADKYENHSILVKAFNNILHSFHKSYSEVQQYEYIVTNLSEGIFWADSQGKILLTNSAFDTIRGKHDSFIDLFDWHDIFEVFDMKEVEHHSRLYLIIVNQVKHKNENHYIGIVSDITTQRQNEEARMRLKLELSKARRLADMGLLIEGISHNMNAPLHNLMGYAQLMKDDFPNNCDLDKIMENGNRLAEIIKTLLNRMSAELSSQMELININELVKMEFEFFDHHLQFKNKINKKIILAENLPKVELIYSDMSQVVANLINNAIDATILSEKKDIEISTLLIENEIVIAIKDSGIGMSKELQKRIFEPFFTSKKEGNQRGFGIGLFISKELLKPYKGRLSFVSEPNIGTTFKIHLPIIKDNK